MERNARTEKTSTPYMDDPRWPLRAGLRLACLAAAFVLASCASPIAMALLSAGASAGTGAGIDYTMNGIAYRTFAAPIPDVRQATVDGLKRLDMKITKNEKSEKGWEIQAAANQREIDIHLERLTSKTTRMRVVVNNWFVFKDRSTETTIIEQATNALDRRGVKQRLAEGRPN